VCGNWHFPKRLERAFGERELVLGGELREHGKKVRK
jgi:hypothetical protein